jgi:uncharacterized protein YggE
LKGETVKRTIQLFAAAVACMAGVTSASAQDAYRPERGALLQIQAVGQVDERPDVMTLYASVVTTGATAAEALDHNNALAGRLIDAIKTSNIPVSRLQTNNLSVDPRMAEQDTDGDGERDDEVPRILGYIVRNSLDVELADLSKASELMGLLFEAGANEIRGPAFTLRDPIPAQRRAEQAAIAEARARAENYAAALGMKVGRVVRVFDTEFTDGDPQGNRIVVTGSRIRATPIEPGEITVSARVNVEFLLEPS